MRYVDVNIWLFLCVSDGLLRQVIKALFGHQGNGIFTTGIFGTLSAYFMTVENQKRGSLHGHAVLYVTGVTPDSVKDYLAIAENKTHLIKWLESVVREILPSAPPVREAPAACYRCPDPFALDFDANFERYAADVVLSANIHTHTATCYKYLKPWQPKVCRMEYGRQLLSATTVNSETGGIFHCCNFCFFFVLFFGF